MINKLAKLYFIAKLRWLLYKHNIPYKYIKNELDDFIEDLGEWLRFWESHDSFYEFLLWRIEDEFLTYVKTKKIVERNKYIEKLNKSIE